MAESLLNDIKKGLVDLRRSKYFFPKDSTGIAIYGKSLALSCRTKGYYGGQYMSADVPCQNYKAPENELVYFDCADEDGQKVDHTVFQQKYFNNLYESISLMQAGWVSKKEQFRVRLAVTQQLMAVSFLLMMPLLFIFKQWADRPNIDLANYNIATKYFVGLIQAKPEAPVGYLFLGFACLCAIAWLIGVFTSPSVIGSSLYKRVRSWIRGKSLSNHLSKKRFWYSRIFYSFVMFDIRMRDWVNRQRGRGLSRPSLSKIRLTVITAAITVTAFFALRPIVLFVVELFSRIL
jgi:hypothetical protein